jgi:Inositol monophosphatase family
MGGGSNTRFLWVLDPIDGTKSFITGVCDPEHCPRCHQACCCRSHVCQGLTDVLAVVCVQVEMVSTAPHEGSKAQPCVRLLRRRQASVGDSHCAAGRRRASAGNPRPAGHAGALAGRRWAADHPQRCNSFGLSAVEPSWSRRNGVSRGLRHIAL